MLGNYLPTGDLDRLVKKHGTGKMNRQGNLHGVKPNVLGSLTPMTNSRLVPVLFKPMQAPNSMSSTSRLDARNAAQGETKVVHSGSGITLAGLSILSHKNEKRRPRGPIFNHFSNSLDNR